MYLRTTARRNQDGTVVRYYQLAENVWDPQKRCAVAKVIYSFGRVQEAEAEKLRRLARSILRVFPDEASLRAEDDIHIRDSHPYGGVYVLEALWREVGIPDALRTHLPAGSRTAYERALFAMVANRALAPYSKLYCHEQWVPEEVYLPRAAALELHQFYFAMDALERYKAEIEKAIYFRTADLLKADVDLIFYDTTSLHFEIDEEDEAEVTVKRLGRTYPPLRRRGRAKNGRGDAPQILVALAVTRDGLPVRSWVFPGQTNDGTTVARVKDDLRGWRLGRCVFVGDAGMNSEANRRSLALGSGKYILATKLRAGDEVTHAVLTRPGRFHPMRDNLRVKEVCVGAGEGRRRYVVCFNPEEATRQQKQRAKLLALLQAELAALDQAPAEPGCSQRAAELRASARFGRYLRQTPRGRLRLDRAAVAREAKLDGKWVVTSNDDTLTAEDLALGYKQLMRVEECWRALKSGLRMRPVYHWRPHRVCAHVSLCVLALLLERIAEIRAGDTWRNLRAQLQTIKVVEYLRGEARIVQTTDLRPEVARLLTKLAVPPPPRVHEVTAAAEPA
jgi:transposase